MILYLFYLLRVLSLLQRVVIINVHTAFRVLTPCIHFLAFTSSAAALPCVFIKYVTAVYRVHTHRERVHTYRGVLTFTTLSLCVLCMHTDNDTQTHRERVT